MTLDGSVKTELIFGHIEIQTRMRPVSNGLIGEVRTITYHGDGRVTDTGWQPTGVSCSWEESEPRRWWQFWL